MVLFCRFWAQEKYLSLFGGHLSAKEFLEAHHNFVGGHGCFPERFLYLDHATRVIQSTNDTLVKFEHGGNFLERCTDRSRLARRAGRPAKDARGAPKIKPGSPVETEARPHATRTKSKAAAKSVRSARAGSKAARHLFSHHRDLWADFCR